MKFLNKVDRLLALMERWTLGATIILMAVLLIANVFSRYVMNFSFPFTQEIGQFLVIIMTFIGMSYAARQGRHIHMSGLLDKARPIVRKSMMLIISAFTAVTLFIVAGVSVRYLYTLVEWGIVSLALRIPLYFVLWVVPLGLALTGLQYVRTFILNLKQIGAPIVNSEKEGA